MAKAFFITTVLGIVLSLGLSARRLAHVISEDVLDEAAAAIREDFQTGDLILFGPHTMSGPRTRLGDLPCHSPRVPTAELLGEITLGYRRAQVLELNVLGATGLTEKAESLGSVTKSQTWPGVRWTTVLLGDGPRLLFDLHQHLAQVTVTARYADGTQKLCNKRKGKRWLCPRDPSWSYVGPEILDIGDEARRCVWLHPLDKNGVLTVQLPPLRGVGLELHAGFGFTRHAARAARSPVQVRISSGKIELWRGQIQPNHSWQRARAVLPENAPPVRLELWTPHNGAAHLCGNVRVVER